MYLVGALENVKLAKIYYPEWVCRFYVDEKVNDAFAIEIEKNGGEIVRMTPRPNAPFDGMFWRFMAIDDPEVDIVISRDCDSRLGFREKAAVDEWLSSGKSFHTMHDHFAHRSVPVLGGMWGAKRGCLDGMSGKIARWGNYANKGIDQIFLRDVIWGSVKDNTISHSSIVNRWNSYIPFPKHESDQVHYVGEIFDENNNRVIS